MGNNSTKYINQELQRCDTHKIEPDDKAQYEFLTKLRGRRFNEATIVKRSVTSHGITYTHYGVLLSSDPIIVIQFGTGDLMNPVIQATYETDVLQWTIDERNPLDTEESEECLLNRAFKIMGSRHFSLIVCNSEHVANYIVKNDWRSDAVMRDTGITPIYIGISSEARTAMNKMPREIDVNFRKRQKITEHPLLKFEDERDVKVALLRETNNILVVGTSGSGKSNLINYLLGQCILDIAKSTFLGSTTTKTTFIKCYRNRKIVNIIDTPGVGDSKLSARELLKKITHPILSSQVYIHQIWIVQRCESAMSDGDRITLSNVVDWLKRKKKIENIKVIFTRCQTSNQPAGIDQIKRDFLKICKIEPLPNSSFTAVDLTDPTENPMSERNLLQAIQVFEKWIDEEPEPLQQSDFSLCRIL